MAPRKESGWHVFLALSAFIAIVFTWLLIPPTVVRNAWMSERAEIFALVGQGEPLIFRSAMNSIFYSIASDFRGYVDDAGALSDGPFGHAGFSRWARERITATWLWIGLVAYRLHVLAGWLLPGIPLASVAYMDGHYIREIRKYSFVAQSPIRHKLGIRVTSLALAGLTVWLLIPVRLPVLIAPILTVSIAYSLWLWVSNLQKRL